MTTWTTTIDSPVGPLLLTSDGTSLTRVLFDAEPDPEWSPEPCALLDEAVRQLEEYFAGERTEFHLPLEPTGTAFQKATWMQLREIPYAETINYGQLAGRVGNPAASRAVGLANGRNPISIVVPCHRVIGADGSLTGYAGGLDAKRALLDHERGVTSLSHGVPQPR